MKTTMSKDGSTIIVSIPMQMKKRGGRTLIIAPTGMGEEPPPREETLAKLVARAHHWLRLLEEKRFASVRELAAHENLDASYIAKILRLTLLARTNRQDSRFGPTEGRPEGRGPWMARVISSRRFWTGGSRTF
ncbi:hypothetical protein SIID45300_02292 [Candidatus Magnetaquicoccaceae bacterium FCR-1]|uniref:Uncharacterized protein n=1 Tax=Candidatus Magnetaquiglobus chichijimensis TaxID=3141448 RepID=A0ABQ0CAQ1_9PROT